MNGWMDGWMDGWMEWILGLAPAGAAEMMMTAVGKPGKRAAGKEITGRPRSI
jgi:hypothetical protein